MAKPVVVIVGRQNVGKSTLFNRMVGRRRAIVKDEPGVTRDRLYEEAEWEGRKFILIDTGGFLTGSDNDVIAKVKDHALEGIDEADLVIHLLDGKDGLLPGDRELADFIRTYNKKVLWVVNKIDTPKSDNRLYDFYSLGGSVIPLSAEHGLGFDDLMDEVVSQMGPEETVGDEATAELPRIAIVGRPNVGKSTMVNAILGKERMIVSPVAGTTRDAIDSVCTYYGRKYVLVDTAGIRKKGKISEDVEYFSVVRAIRSIERSDVTLVLLDGSEGVVEQDKKIVYLVKNAGKGLIVLINKWDTVEDTETAYTAYLDTLGRELGSLDYAPILTTSGITKKRITKIFPIIDEIVQTRRYRIGTGALNRLTDKINKALPMYSGRQAKVFYATQVDIEPPQFAIFANYPDAIKSNHVRHMERIIREEYPFKGTPIRIFIKKRMR